ncbi:MAG TPA: protein kinase [Pyrinomonadaceae bacterium]|nr:protein kinase [Pyrinomonadaceae bacterium]
MTPERWQQVKEIFHAALEREPAFRPDFLVRACGADPELRAEVESLISAHEDDESFIDKPALGAGLLDEAPDVLRPGQRFGDYEIVKRIGRGGMGEVYLATERTLGRKVALKLLPAAYTRNQDRLRRFEQEARAASALSHPNIITIYRIGESGGAHFIATEYVEGETLRQRLSRSRAGTGESLGIATQIAEALDAAHKAGIVHRDIKPENVMLRPDGYVKVLDFGLAKLAEPRAGVVSDPEAETRVAVQTTPGAVMGTVNYMSPEQARGLGVDGRTDVWSLGCVLYECATGRDPFAGPTPSDTLSNILQREPPPLSRQLSDAPAELERIVSKALRKDREARYQGIRDLLVDLKSLKQELDFAAKLERSGAPDARASQGGDAHGDGHARPAAVAARTDENGRAAVTAGVGAGLRPREAGGRRGLFAASAVAALVLVAAAAFGVYKFVLPRLRPAHFQRTNIARLTNSGKAIDAAVSPDGKYLAYVLSDAGQQSLWIRQTSAANDTQIVAPARVGFWGMTFSPDGDEIYYGVKSGGPGGLYRIPALGGTPVKVMDAVDGAVSFSPDGEQIAYVLGDPARGESGLYVANADGTGARQIASRKLPEYFVPIFYTGPSWSPDGRLVAAAIGAGSGGARVIAVAPEGGGEQVLTRGTWIDIRRVHWLPDMSGLMMIANSPEVTNTQVWHVAYPGGEARRVTNDLGSFRSLSLTSDGKKLATVSQSSLMSVWVAPDADAARAEELPTGNVGFIGGFENIDTLPDGRVLYTSTQDGKPGVWLMNADGTGRRQLTADSYGFNPTASPDGRFILYTTYADGRSNIWRMSVEGGGAARLTDGSEDRSPAVSPDGRWVVYSSFAGGRMTLWKVPIEGGAPSQLTDRVAYAPQVSPDGRLIAYAYSHYPNTEFIKNPAITRIAVMPFEGGDPVRIFEIRPSNAVQPTLRWSRDGRALLYTLNEGGVGNVWSQPLEGGQPTQLTQFKEKAITTFTLTRDNKLYCARGISLRDAVLITDLD